MIKFSLELALVVLTTLTALVIIWYKLASRGVDEPPAQSGFLAGLVDFSKSFFPVLLAVLVIRSFIFEPYKIPSSSMVPTLLVGDFIFVSKFSYGVRLPLTHTKIIDTGGPERGDVAVFRLPRDPSINYVKRVIGLPGDTVEYEKGRLVINGEVMPLEKSVVFARDDDIGDLYVETIDGRDHVLLHSSNRRAPAKYTVIVPEGFYFCMGDNRENSTDSRFAEVGLVPEKNLVGRAGRIWFNYAGGHGVGWGRIGLKIE